VHLCNHQPICSKHHQCVPNKFNLTLSRLMTHNHVNIKSNDLTRHAMTQPDKQLCKTMTHHDKQFKSSEQLFKHTVHDSLSKHCSGQLIKAIIQEYCSRRTIIQEQSKIHYYLAMFHFWRGSSPSSTRSLNNARLSTEVINTRFNLTIHLYTFNSTLYFINRYSIELH